MAARTGKKDRNNGGVKAFIAAASVAATLAGWAMLPANDPQATASASQDNVAGLTAPDSGQSGSINTPSQSLDNLPQVGVPQGSGNTPSGFTRTHSSR